MSEITMYGAEWCGDCSRSKKFLDSNNVKYNYIDVEADASASDKVIEINGGMRSIPVILFLILINSSKILYSAPSMSILKNMLLMLFCIFNTSP